MRWKILFWVGIFILEAAVITVFLSDRYISNQQRKEFEAVRYILGAKKEARVNQSAKKTYNKAFVESGFVRGFYKTFTVSKQERANSRGLEDLGNEFIPWGEKRFKIFMKVMYGAIYRFYYLINIIPFVLAAIMAGIIDGLVRREIKKKEFLYANPTFYHFAKNLLWATAAAPILFAFLPLGVNPYIFVLWLVIIPLILWLGVSNVQHYAEN